MKNNPVENPNVSLHFCRLHREEWPHVGKRGSTFVFSDPDRCELLPRSPRRSPWPQGQSDSVASLRKHVLPWLIGFILLAHHRWRHSFGFEGRSPSFWGRISLVLMLLLLIDSYSFCWRHWCLRHHCSLVCPKACAQLTATAAVNNRWLRQTVLATFLCKTQQKIIEVIWCEFVAYCSFSKTTKACKHSSLYRSVL